MVISINIKKSLRLRPSVSVVPTNNENVWEFFQSNSRQIRRIRIRDMRLIEEVINLEYSSLEEVIISNPDLKLEFTHLFEALMNWCLIEYCDVAEWIQGSKNYRTLNFLADFIPSYSLVNETKKLTNSTVLIFGCGGIGSIIADSIASMGVHRLILCDPDNVKPHNLNRGVFTTSNLDEYKTEVLMQRFSDLYPDVEVKCVNELISKKSQVTSLFQKLEKIDLVVNAADYPNVDASSKLIFPECMKSNIPHIVAGGYNLHLSLIGPTIIPEETPCFKCIEMGLEKIQEEDFSHIRKLVRPKRNIGNISPLAGISASFTINESLRVLLRSRFLLPQMIGKRGEFNFFTNKVNYTSFERQENCTWCSSKYK